MKKQLLILMASILAGTVAAVLAFSVAAGSVNPDLQPAAPGEGTYTLAEFRFQYPFGADLLPDTPPDSDHAGVSYMARWVGGAFPGRAECQVTLHDVQGGVVGTWRFSLTSLLPEARISESSVEVTGEPVVADASCAKADAPSGSYRFEDLRIQQPSTDQDRLELIGRVTTDSVDPGTPRCTATFESSDAPLDHISFNLTAGDGTPFELNLPDSYTHATGASIDCVPMS